MPRYVRVRVERVQATTQRAALVLVAGTEHWLPHSGYRGRLSPGDGPCDVEVQRWLADAKKMAYSEASDWAE